MLFLYSAYAQTPPELLPEPLPAPDTHVLTFGEDLNVASDLMLQGLNATQTVAFTTPRAWELVDDPVVELRVDHSNSLIEGRSSLTVRVNNQSLTTIALGEHNTTDTVVRVAVPRRLLSEFNTLHLQVVQHVDEDCEDPFDPSLWTRVSRLSTLTMWSEDAVVVPELLAFPFPLHDDRGYGATRLTVVGTGPLSDATLAAYGDLGLALGRFAGYRTIQVEDTVSSLEELSTHGMVVGILGADPIVSQLVPQGLAPGEGLVAIVPAPHDPTLAVLVVAGADAEGLAKAVEAISSQDRYPVLSGAAARVSAVKAAPPPLTREVQRPAPRGRTNFTLRDLGFQDTTVRGYYAQPIRIPLALEGDATPRPGARLRLRYAHSDLVNGKVSAVELRLNGVVLRSRHLNKPDDGQQVLDVELPVDVLSRQNELEVYFYLFPEDFDACRRVSDRQLWASVFASSEVALPRDSYAEMPDLSRLRTGMWPISLDPLDGGTVVLTTDAPTGYDAGAVVRIAAELGRVSVAADPSLSVQSGRAGLSSSGARNVVILADAERPHGAYDGLAAVATLTGGPNRLLGVGGALLASIVQTPYGTVEELMNPAHPSRGVLIVRAAAPGGLLRAVHALTDPARMANYAGNAVVLPAEGGARVLDVAPRHPVGTVSLDTRARSWLSSAWPLIGVTVPLAALIAAWLITRWARARGGRA